MNFNCLYFYIGWAKKDQVAVTKGFVVSLVLQRDLYGIMFEVSQRLCDPCTKML